MGLFQIIHLSDIKELLKSRPVRREDDPEFVKLKEAIRTDFQPNKSLWVVNRDGAVLRFCTSSFSMHFFPLYISIGGGVVVEHRVKQVHAGRRSAPLSSHQMACGTR